jgi:hypothetical protein
VQSLDTDLDRDFERSELIDLGRWENRSVLQRSMEATTKPIRRWL